MHFGSKCEHIFLNYRIFMEVDREWGLRRTKASSTKIFLQLVRSQNVDVENLKRNQLNNSGLVINNILREIYALCKKCNIHGHTFGGCMRRDIYKWRDRQRFKKRLNLLCDLFKRLNICLIWRVDNFKAWVAQNLGRRMSTVVRECP